MIRTIAAVLMLAAAPAYAAGDLSRQEPIRVNLTLGTPEGEARFTPDRLDFETGKLYVLHIDNAGRTSYYFGSQGMADAVYTRKVSVLNASGEAAAEVYGAVRRVEVKPGASLEWWFVPVRTGSFDDVMSTKKHTEAGMRAIITIR